MYAEAGKLYYGRTTIHKLIYHLKEVKLKDAGIFEKHGKLPNRSLEINDIDFGICFFPFFHREITEF